MKVMYLSLSLQGAWIEIWSDIVTNVENMMSLSLQGAWIEILGTTLSFQEGSQSLSLQGAWIEILCHFQLYEGKYCRSLYRERGLKLYN